MASFGKKPAKAPNKIWQCGCGVPQAAYVLFCKRCGKSNPAAVAVK